MEWSKLRRLRELIRRAAESLTDEDALDGVELFEPWEPDKQYAADVRMRYGEKLYKVVQPHTSQADWPPDKTPALYTEVAKPGEIPVWKQPTGVQDAYMIGDKVHYPDADDPVYVSTVDNNVWQPGIYGWEITGAENGGQVARATEKGERFT